MEPKEITSAMFFSCEYSTNMTNIELWLRISLPISSREHSINLTMGLDMCNSYITGFQSASGGLLGCGFSLKTRNFLVITAQRDRQRIAQQLKVLLKIPPHSKVFSPTFPNRWLL